MRQYDFFPYQEYSTTPIVYLTSFLTKKIVNQTTLHRFSRGEVILHPWFESKKEAAKEIHRASLTELIIPLRKIPNHLLHQKHITTVHLSKNELAMLRAAFEVNSTPSAVEIENIIIENFPGRTIRFIKHWFYCERRAKKVKCKASRERFIKED